MKIPEIINAFNVYVNGNTLVGVSSEVELPELEALTDTLSGAGIGGEIEVPAVGHFSSMESTIPFSNLHTNLGKLISVGSSTTITLRGSTQCIENTTGAIGYYAVKIVFRGKAKKIALGTMKQGGKGEPEVTLENEYIKVTVDGTTLLEVDKLNFKYIVNGTDMLATVRKHI